MENFAKFLFFLNVCLKRLENLKNGTITQYQKYRYNIHNNAHIVPAAKSIKVRGQDVRDLVHGIDGKKVADLRTKTGRQMRKVGHKANN